MKKTHIYTTLMALVFSGSLFAETLVNVNGQKIDSTDVNRIAQIIVTQEKIPDSPQLRNTIVQNLVISYALAQEAKKLGLDKSKEYKTALDTAVKQAKEKGENKKPDYQNNLEIYKTEFLADLFRADVLKKSPVSEKDVQSRYDEVKARYHGTDEVKLNIMSFESEEKAQSAIKDLKAKKKADDVAKKYDVALTTSPTLSLVDVQEQQPSLYQNIKDLKINQFVPTPFLLHANEKIYDVILMKDRRTIQFPALENIREGIRQELEENRIYQATQAVLDKADIKPAK